MIKFGLRGWSDDLAFNPSNSVGIKALDDHLGDYRIMLAAFPLLLAAASPQSIALADTAARPATPVAASDDTAANPPAPAPEPQADPQAAPTPGGDIVVTARRRSERLQTVPLAVAVLSGETLANAGAFNVNRLQQFQPALQFYSSNPRNSAINIRGLGAPFGLTNDGIEQGVGLYIDQVYIGRVGASTFDFVDIDRVEVLRGPQGTLYGKNTTAGAVNITTKKPNLTSPEATFEVSAGNYGLVQLKASASAPIADDKLGVRLSTSVTKRGGSIYDTAIDKNLQKQDNFSVRGQLLWQATPNLDFNFSADFSLQNPYCCVQYYARVGATQRPLNRQYAALAAAAGYKPPSFDPFDRVTDLDASINSRQEVGGLSLVGSWDVGAIGIGNRPTTAISSVCRSRPYRKTPRSRNNGRRNCASPRTATASSTTRSAHSSSIRRSIRRGRRCKALLRAGGCSILATYPLDRAVAPRRRPMRAIRWCSTG
jgi:iron complex outermembrane receptor protein